MGLLAGKKGIILGLANDKSIAWSVAKIAHQEGATLGFNYLNEVLEKRVKPLAASINAPLVERLDVASDPQMNDFFTKVEEKFGKIDFLVHSVAFANKDTLGGRFLDLTRADFQLALDISCYSFIAAANKAAKIMNQGGSILTFSYLGSERAMPNYNVMGVAKAALEASVRYTALDLGKIGIRVNAISAGPIRTLASAGINGIRAIIDENAKGSLLRKNIVQDDVGKSALYFLSDMSSGVTGEIHYVDAGYNAGIGGFMGEISG